MKILIKEGIIKKRYEKLKILGEKGGIYMAKDNSMNQEQDQTSVRVSEDMLEAYITICPPRGVGDYTVDDVRKKLAEAQIVFGIDEALIEDIVKYKRYFQEFCIAKGKEPKDGEDGYFEFLFEINVDTRPKVLKDGSVDYHSIKEIPVVTEGQEIVHYVKATKGYNGINVRGAVVIAKHGKELQPLRGKGFTMSEDKTVYTAKVTGKASYENGKLNVTNVIVIDHDVTLSTGDVTFSGDIEIRGNVTIGTVVKAAGNISVEGSVEVATLIAGKNIVIKNGMQGGGKGKIETKGSVSGKFFEQVVINAKGSVRANTIMNCDVTAGEDVEVDGRLGVIVGGTTRAMHCIKATIIGNMAEIKTVVSAGAESNLYEVLLEQDKKINAIAQELNKAAEGLKKIEQAIQAGNAALNAKKMPLMRVKIERDSALTKALREKDEILSDLKKSNECKIEVRKSIYPGVCISLNGTKQLLKDENYAVTYQKRGTDIETIPTI